MHPKSPCVLLPRSKHTPGCCPSQPIPNPSTKHTGVGPAPTTGSPNLPSAAAGLGAPTANTQLPSGLQENKKNHPAAIPRLAADSQNGRHLKPAATCVPRAPATTQRTAGPRTANPQTGSRATRAGESCAHRTNALSSMEDGSAGRLPACSSRGSKAFAGKGATSRGASPQNSTPAPAPPRPGRDRSPSATHSVPAPEARRCSSSWLRNSGRSAGGGYISPSCRRGSGAPRYRGIHHRRGPSSPHPGPRSPRGASPVHRPAAGTAATPRPRAAPTAKPTCVPGDTAAAASAARCRCVRAAGPGRAPAPGSFQRLDSAPHGQRSATRSRQRRPARP